MDGLGLWVGFDTRVKLYDVQRRYDLFLEIINCRHEWNEDAGGFVKIYPGYIADL